MTSSVVALLIHVFTHQGNGVEIVDERLDPIQGKLLRNGNQTVGVANRLRVEAQVRYVHR
jgi:hypothetical protein